MIEGSNLGIIWMVIIFLVLLYFIPSVVAKIRGKVNFTAILLINLFLGWTLVGWIGALIWAVIKEKTDKPYDYEKKREEFFEKQTAKAKVGEVNKHNKN